MKTFKHKDPEDIWWMTPDESPLMQIIRESSRRVGPLNVRWLEDNLSFDIESLIDPPTYRMGTWER